MNIMRKTICIPVLAALGLMSLSSCQQQNISLPVEFNVELDSDNVYRPGEIVRFRFTGDADYITFYSGETGHEFDKRERTSIPLEDIKSLSMDMKIQPLWGIGALKPDIDYGFRIFLSKEFKGFSSADGYEQRKEIQKMIDEGQFPKTEEEADKPWKQIWNDINCESVANEWKYGYSTDDLSEYAGNFCLAFHWKPNTLNWTRNQRTYHIKGNIDMEYGKDEKRTTTFAEVPFTVVTMNEQDPPHLGTNPTMRGDTTTIGTVHFGNPSWDIDFEGAASNYPGLNWELDVWCISDPMPLNSVSKDKGVQIKSMLSPVLTYDHVYEKPGTYKAVFYGVNDNYQGTKTAVKELTIIVVDDPPFSKTGE